MLAQAWRRADRRSCDPALGTVLAGAKRRNACPRACVTIPHLALVSVGQRYGSVRESGGRSFEVGGERPWAQTQADRLKGRDTCTKLSPAGNAIHAPVCPATSKINRSPCVNHYVLCERQRHGADLAGLSLQSHSQSHTTAMACRPSFCRTSDQTPNSKQKSSHPPFPPPPRCPCLLLVMETLTSSRLSFCCSSSSFFSYSADSLSAASSARVSSFNCSFVEDAPKKPRGQARRAESQGREGSSAFISRDGSYYGFCAIWR